MPMSRSYTVTILPYPNVIWKAVLTSRQSSYTTLWKLSTHCLSFAQGEKAGSARYAHEWLYIGKGVCVRVCKRTLLEKP